MARYEMTMDKKHCISNRNHCTVVCTKSRSYTNVHTQNPDTYAYANVVRTSIWLVDCSPQLLFSWWYCCTISCSTAQSALQSQCWYRCRGLTHSRPAYRQPGKRNSPIRTLKRTHTYTRTYIAAELADIFDVTDQCLSWRSAVEKKAGYNCPIL